MDEREKAIRRIQVIQTPTGPLRVIRPVAEQLLAQGVVSGALDGELHAADAATVKAAMLASAGVCDFCSAPGATHVYNVHDFDMPFDAGRSIGGWAACDACAELVRGDKRKQLLQRSLEHMAFPKFSHGAVAELHSRFWKAIGDNAEAVGAAAAVVDYINDTLPPDVPQPALTSLDARRERIMRQVGLTRPQVAALLGGEGIDADAMRKLSAFAKQFGGSTVSAREALRRAVEGQARPLPVVVPHWQTALDARFAALTHLSALLRGERDRSVHFPEATDLNDPVAVRKVMRAAQRSNTLADLGYGEDVQYLKLAQAYSFSGETVAAIREAARSLPHDAPLSSVETPNAGAGWFWFAEPLALASSPAASDQTNALLWGWTDGKAKHSYVVKFDDELLSQARPESAASIRKLLSEMSGTDLDFAAGGEVITSDDAVLYKLGEHLRAGGITQEMLNLKTRVEKRSGGAPAIMFSAYVYDEKGRGGRGVAPGVPMPSTRWYWPWSMTLHDMLAYNAANWERDYAPGAPHADLPYLVGKDETLRCVAELSMFFLMACLWFKQTVPAEGGKARKREPVLVTEAGHVERHARKRLAREHALKEPPTVQVVALRRTVREATEDAPQERQASARDYQCRWIVRGHPRLQACGPGRKDRKLIWIEPHPAGPPDKPLRVREKVFAVVR